MWVGWESQAGPIPAKKKKIGSTFAARGLCVEGMRQKGQGVGLKKNWTTYLTTKSNTNARKKKKSGGSLQKKRGGWKLWKGGTIRKSVDGPEMSLRGRKRKSARIKRRHRETRKKPQKSSGGTS